ncbi:MAG: HAD-IIB family hydrolase [Bacteroidales bacterium]|jgi:mannosyl-3-phosphoglycerate phosphatase|nr:HAD-IIB family hydrolase [Bacteroidales bacterium]
MYIIFTDLDGTLLDYDTYSFERAGEVLACIREKNLPLVAVTSKTAEEVKQIIRALNISHPFVVENGGGIFFPETYPGEFPRTQPDNGYYVVSFARLAMQPAEVLNEISSHIGIRLEGFSNLSVEEIISYTGLSAEEAGKAKQRQFSEPFIIPPGKSVLKKIIRLSDSCNYKIVLGGRFAHLIPMDSGKGNAVKFLLDFYKKQFPDSQFISIGLGDSYNDFDFLSITDISIIIRNKGRTLRSVKKNWIVSQKPGVEGWAEEVKKIICP